MNCPYCGKGVRDSDKFCLFCGEPLLKHAPANDQNAILDKEQALAQAGTGPEKPAKKGQLFPQTATAPVDDDETLVEEVSIEADPDHDDKNVEASREASVRELDPAVKTAIQARIELFQLAKKIKKVNERLTDSLKMMEDPDFQRKYDLDDDFRKANSIRFEALKQIGEELKKQKQELEAKISPDFVLDLNNKKIRRLKLQVEELNNSFKMRKIDKQAYEALHAEYKIQLTSLVKDREIVNIQLGAWAGELKMQQEDLKHQFNVLKGRKAAKEISKEDLKEQKIDIEKRLARVGEDIKVIKSFIFTD